MKRADTSDFDKDGSLRDRFKKLAKVDAADMELETDVFMHQISSIVSEIPRQRSTTKKRQREREQFIAAVKKAAAYGVSLTRLAVLEFANEDHRQAKILTREILQLELLAKKLATPVSNIVLQSPKSLAAVAVIRTFAMYRLPDPDTRGSFAELCLAEVLRCARLTGSDDDTADSHRDLLRRARTVLSRQE